MNDIETPFLNRATSPVQKTKLVNRRRIYLITGFIAAVFIIVIAFAIKGYASDRFRTLELIDTQELLENHERLLGGKFKLMATVDAELGVEPGKGKLVAFRDAESQKIIPVLITSEELTSRTLSKGQRYKMEVEVTRGGLLQLNHLEKD